MVVIWSTIVTIEDKVSYRLQHFCDCGLLTLIVHTLWSQVTSRLNNVIDDLMRRIYSILASNRKNNLFARLIYLETVLCKKLDAIKKCDVRRGSSVLSTAVAEEPHCDRL